jgi:hypothetical protein
LQLNDGYDATYSQQRMESQQIQQVSSLLSEQEVQQQNQFWDESQELENYYPSMDGGEGQENADYSGAAGGENTGEEWSQFYDENGYVYYYNNFTGQSQYENPYQ